MKINKSVIWASGGIVALALVIAIAPSMKVFADNGSEGASHGLGAGNLPIVGTSTGLPVALPGLVNAADHVSANLQSEGEGQGQSGMNSTQESVAINASGNFKVSGAQVVSVDTAAGTITATLYGLTDTVNVGSAAITGGNATMTLGDIKAGDVISATGNLNPTTHAITVNTIDDVSALSANQSAIQAKISSLMQIVQQLQAQLQSILSGSGASTGSGN
jgi:hypothetical protein